MLIEYTSVDAIGDFNREIQIGRENFISLRKLTVKKRWEKGIVRAI